ncbi:MAG: adenylate/guanylate cyclase domain-containing protein [Bacteroidota bacterium]
MIDKSFHILYVDDEKHNLSAFRALFRRSYNIFIANSGPEAIEILHENSIHLIITDQRMPGMTGVEFLGKIRIDFPDPIRMILTGFSDTEAIIDAINKGQVSRYITKPWNDKELHMEIESARELYQLRAKNKSLFRELQQRLEEQERTVQIFQRYVPEPVVKKVLSSSPDSIFEGEQRAVSVLFCDIRGFTSLSEQLPPRQVVGILNHYYRMMTEVVESYGGTVNQFVGDEVFAVFGAPMAQKDHEEQATLCAIEMIRTLDALNEICLESYQCEIHIGIGVNSGEVVAGNMGSSAHMAYSVVGDTVNTGKRIESLTKTKYDTIFISESIYRKVQDRVKARAHEPIAVKGKKEKIKVYEVLMNGEL